MAHKIANRLTDLALFIVVMLFVWHHIRNSSPFDGVWLAEDGRGDTYHPAEMRLARAGDQLKMSYVDGGGMSVVAWTCDGAEHPSRLSDSFPFNEVRTYHALLKGGIFEFTQASDSAPGMLYTERWSLGDGDKRLFVRYGACEKTYSRAHWSRALFRGVP